MTANQHAVLRYDEIDTMLREANEAQEELTLALDTLQRIHSRFYQGDSHIQAYVLDYLKILISDDHGFLSRDANVSTFITELEEARDEAEEPSTCAMCGNPFERALLTHDLCATCYPTSARTSDKLTIAAFRGDDGNELTNYYGYSVWGPCEVVASGDGEVPYLGDRVLTASMPHYRSLDVALAAGVDVARRIQNQQIIENVRPTCSTG